VREYPVIYERDARNWSAYIPDLPGCIATTKTRQQVEQRIREAIEFHIEGSIARGEPVLAPSVEAGTVSVSVGQP
jgi:predicted RNase H-like HicB family nuclease